MIYKIVIFFLIGMAILGMFGRIRLPKKMTRIANRCPDCGKFKIGKGDCSCKGKRG